ncbi:MAG: hypothetical protein ACJAYD_000014, partial [Patiriisocius sp.]
YVYSFNVFSFMVEQKKMIEKRMYRQKWIPNL